ncbi:hypothetical protein CDIOL_13320 [Clostridium diolis]|uniref:Uncharacterized protein n=1 Tax=Clostridium diolis TaxID=223919 RepID=A0AAV3W046_9CLOT|nr:hypothetical protein CDIOL_13320 [Clostridium diolis]
MKAYLDSYRIYSFKMNYIQVDQNYKNRTIKSLIIQFYLYILVNLEFNEFIF